MTEDKTELTDSQRQELVADLSAIGAKYDLQSIALAVEDEGRILTFTFDVQMHETEEDAMNYIMMQSNLGGPDVTH